MTLGEAIDAVEETYEFMLAYAAQGRRQEDNDTTGGIRACFWQNFWAMMPDREDLRAPFAKPGKYSVAQKLYHLAISVLILAAIGTGLLMWRKVDTPFWQRDPYWLSTDAWGVVYAIHGLAAMALVTMVIIHVYFALRPDEWHLTRSMLRGWITGKEYRDHHDPRRWQAKD